MPILFWDEDSYLGGRKAAAYSNVEIHCNWYNLVSCTEMIRDTEPIKGNSAWDKTKEKKYSLYVN